MILKLEELTKIYKDTTALDNITFSFTSGIYGLLGPNGAGKSTMMNLITDNLKPTRGRVLLDGCSIEKWGRNTGNFWDICRSNRIFTRSSPSGVSCILWLPLRV